MIYRFGEFELDTVGLTLRRRGKIVAIDPMPLKMLIYLVENHGRTVSIEELVRVLHDGDVVSHGAVTTNKHRIKVALNDTGDYIKAYGGGYRFVAPVTKVLAKPCAEDDIVIGQDEVDAHFQAAIEGALEGKGSFQLFEGGLGLGKSYLLQRLGKEATRRGMHVFGSLWASSNAAPVFSTWVRAVIGKLSPTDPSILRECLDSSEAEILVPLVPDLYRVIPGLEKPSAESQVPASPETDQERQAAIACFTSVAFKLAQRGPLLFVLDDLHEADRSLCDCLLSLLSCLPDMGCLLAGTYRRSALLSHSPLVNLLRIVEQHRVAKEIQLKEFTRDNVATYLELRTGCIDQRVIDAIYERTDGNPLFVAKIITHAIEEGLLNRPEEILRGQLPQSVQDTIARQMVHLPADVRAVLEHGAVLGREFDIHQLHRLTGRSVPELIELLEAAQRSQIVTISAGIARYRFRHGLVRDTIYLSLGQYERIRRHAEVLKMLEELWGTVADEHVGELAHHAYEGVLAGTEEKAIVYLIAAARVLARQYAYEEAADHYDRALEVIRLAPGDDLRACTVLVAAGVVLSRSGRMEAAEERFRKALPLARGLGAADLFVRAVLGITTPDENVGVPINSEFAKLLEEALSKVEGRLRVSVLRRLAVGKCWSSDAERGSVFSAEAVRLALELDDPVIIAEARLTRRETEWSPDDLDNRLQDDDAIIQTSRAFGHRELLLQGLGARIPDLMEQHGVDRVTDDIREFVAEAQKLQQPRYLWQAEALQGVQASARGDFSGVASHIERAMAWGQRTRGQRPQQVFGVQSWLLLRNQGQLQIIAPKIEAAVHNTPGIPAWTCVWAQICCEMEMRTEARKTFAIVADGKFAMLPRDRFRIAGLCVAAEVCAFLNDRANALVLYDLLQPYSSRYVVIGPTAACLGSTAHYLGLLASTMERWSDADRHFRAALVANDHIKPMLHRTQCEYATVLLKRGRLADQKAALRLLNSAIMSPVLQRMPLMLKRIRELLHRANKK